MPWLGLDIGGANLKLADGHGYAESSGFALWRIPQRLTQQLRTLIAQAPPCDHLAVTMTGELADCFASKTEGVRFILESVNQAADGRHTRVYLNNGQMVTPQVALRRPQEAAAANWHALARFCCRFVPAGPAILLDIGSTTTDVIPLVDGTVATASRSDTARLLSGELVYTGIERTPLCALSPTGVYREQDCPLAAELFATTQDAYIILGDLPEDRLARHTADGAPATKAASRTRLARMICGDSETFNHRDAVNLARAMATVQVKRIAAAVQQVRERLPGDLQQVVLSGHGEFVGPRVLKEVGLSSLPLLSLAQQLGPGVSRAAPAHAVAVLAREGNPP